MPRPALRSEHQLSPRKPGGLKSSSELKIQSERKLQLPRRCHIFRIAESRIPRAADAILIVLRDRARKHRRAVNVVDLFYIGAIKNIESLKTEFALEAFAEWNHALQPHIGGVIRISLVSVTPHVADAVRKRINVTVHVKAGQYRI